MGINEGSKTIKEARKEVGRAINTMTISAEEARRINGETIPFDSAEGSETRVGYYYRFPIGIIAAITPFNRLTWLHTNWDRRLPVEILLF